MHSSKRRSPPCCEPSNRHDPSLSLTGFIAFVPEAEEVPAVKLAAPSIALLLIVLAGLLMAAVSVRLPGLDMELARQFYDPATHRFPATGIASLQWLREQGPVTVIATIACIVVTLLLKLVKPRRPLLISGRAMIFLALTLAVGPGVLVNGVLKSHWGRPRPVEVVQFGGHEHYVPWWNDHGDCPRNCSFVSGESSVAAWLFAPAVLLPPPWRAPAMAAAAVVTVAVGVSRMAYGGHFLSDVAFGALLTLLIVWLVHGLVYRWPRTRLDEKAIDKQLENFAYCMRRAAFGAIGRKGPS
jgi:lipid A 4'-phosphatase